MSIEQAARDTAKDVSAAHDAATVDAGTHDAATVDRLWARGWRLIRRSLVAQPLAHTIAITGGVVFAVAAVALSRVLAWITDEVVVAGIDEGGVDDRRLWAAFVAVMAVGALRGFGAMFRRYYLGKAEIYTQAFWRQQLFDRYLTMPMSFFQDRQTGELLAHVDNDLHVAGMVLRPLAFTVATLVLSVVAMVSLLLVHPLLLVVGLVLFPALAWMNHVYTTHVEAPAAHVQAAVGDVSNVAHESFDGALIVKTLGRQEAEVQRMADASERLRRERLVVGRLRAAFEPGIDALPSLGIIALIAVGAWLVSQDSISIGDVVGAVALFTILSMPVRIVGFFLEEMPRSVVALDRVDRVLDLVAPASRSVGEVLPAGALDVELDRVAFGYGGEPVLSDVSFGVAAGEIVAIVGSTGGGKSTIAELLGGLIEPSQGTVRVGGVGLADVELGSATAAIAVVFQETFLFADTVRQNIALGVEVSDVELRAVARLAQADGFVSALPDGYDTVVGERGVTLSGGQRQRVALARALARKPRVIFLDDATASVDPTVEAAILDGLRAERNLTMLVVAHRLSTIRLADRVVFIEGGTVAGVGSHDQLLGLAAYESLVRAYEDDAAVAAATGPALRLEGGA